MLKLKKIAFMTSMITVVFSGCVMPQNKVISQNEWLKMTTKTYNKSESEILEASKKVFIMADEKDFNFQVIDDNKLIADRDAFYFNSGVVRDRWVIKTANIGVNTTKVSVIAGIPNLFGNASFIDDESKLVLVKTTRETQDNALYDLFYARLDYFLNLKAEWVTCENNDIANNNQTYGSDNKLCDYTFDNKQPYGYTLESDKYLRKNNGTN